MRPGIERAFFRRVPLALRRPAWRRMKARSYRRLTRLASDAGDEYSIVPFEQHNCIFVHVPKTAGVSLSRSLFGGLAGAHTKLRAYELFYDAATFDRYWKFAFVRNPWDRLVSAYTYLAAGGREERDRRWADDHLAGISSFADLVRALERDPVLHNSLHFAPQADFVTCGGRLALDFVGRYERLADDYETVRAHLGIGSELPHLNRTDRRGDYREYYDDHTAEIVGRLYRPDIELFDYRFDHAP